MNFNEVINIVEQASERFGVTNDKFYTNPKIAKMCIQQLNLKAYDRIIEPSAGNGSFSKQIPNCEAYDLVPEDNSIKKQDFLEFKADKGNILVIGNPPFGHANDLTLKFIKKAAEFARTIAFIVPSSCRKQIFINKLPPNVHVRRVVELPKNSFLINGDKKYDVNCCFMIFDIKKTARKAPIPETTNDFKFVGKNEGDFSILRKGWKTGRVLPPDSKISEKSRAYIKSNINPDKLKKRIATLTFPEASYVLGSDSLTQQEFIHAYNLKYGKAASVRSE